MAAAPSSISRTAPDPQGVLRFAVPHGSEIAVDVEGYYVPPGTPVDPFTSANATSSSASKLPGTLSADARLQPAPTAAYSGTYGALYVDADSPFLATGARLSAKTTDPSKAYTVVQTGTTDANSSFMFFNSAMDQNGSPAGEMFKFRSDGPFFFSDQVFLSAHLAYAGSATIRGNVLSDYTVTNPRDSAGGSANRVVFYRGASAGEQGSPATTKFEASTDGLSTQGNVNFDSRYSQAVGSNYHFRALALGDGKETFSVKPIPAADGNTSVNTRAKMFVSGPAGFGTDTPLDAIHVKGSPVAVRVEESSAGAAGSVGLLAIDNQIGPYLVSHTGTDGLATVSASAHRIRFGANVLAIEDAPVVSAGTARVFVPRLQIDSAGRVLVGVNPTVDPASVLNVQGNINVSGNINAKYQDVAEWVSAGASLSPATVVVLDPSHDDQVLPSSHAYDTSVAGVVSSTPGVILGVGGEGKEKIATTGRVKVKVDATRAPIAIGDLLVTSDVPGTAMKSQPIEIDGHKFHQPGTVIGKALQPLPGGRGEILVLLSLQ